MKFVLFLTSVTAESCANTELLEPWCQAANGSLELTANRASCVKNKTVIGLSYADCGIDSIPTDDLSEVTLIDFRQASCPYTDKQTSIGDLYSAEKLDTLYVSKSCDFCPGQFQVNNFTLSKNETFSPWGAADFQTYDYGVCEKPISFCDYNSTGSPFNGYFCPENSMCVDKGIGTFDCQASGCSI